MNLKRHIMENRTDRLSVPEPEPRRPAEERPHWIIVPVYFGLGVFPGLSRWISRGIPGICDLHAARAHVLLGLMVLMTGCFLGLGLAWGAVDPQSGGWISRLIPDEWTLRVAFRRFLLVWLVFWGAGLIYAVRGVRGSLPGIDFLAGRPGIVRMFRTLVQTALVLLITAAGIGFHGLWLCRGKSGSPRCFLLYESMDGRLPAILFGFGYYPMIRAAFRSQHLGGAVLLPLNETNLARAMREGEFVFVGAHGSESGILLADHILSPDDVARMRTGHVPRVVYLAGCHADVERWKSALAPAQVLAWERQVGTAEHIAWIWRKSASIIRSVDHPSGTDGGPSPPDTRHGNG